MNVQQVDNKAEWKGFLETCGETTFMQSWQWSEMQKAMGKRLWRLGVYDENDTLAAIALTVKVPARRGTFLFVSHGPVLRTGTSNSPQPSRAQRRFPTSEQILNELTEYLKKLGKEEGADFIRIAPAWERTEENSRLFSQLGFRAAPLYVHPEVTWEVDLAQSEKELLQDMRKNTRNLVRRGLRTEELTVEEDTTEKGLDIFNELYRRTAERQNFVPFPFSYLQTEFEAFNEENNIAILLARYKDEVISGSILVLWQGTAYYHHGASVQKYKKLPTSYLLQWESMRLAKARGCERYNFWGIAEENAQLGEKHRFAGITLFKKGFGGAKREYVKTQDLPLTRRYWLNYLIEEIRKRRRRVY